MHQLTETEEKALVGLLYNHVTFGTTLQVFGEAASDNARIDTLRGVLEKLLLKYDLFNKLSNDERMLMGFVSHVPKEVLEGWAEDPTNAHLHMRAKYFLAQDIDKI